MRRNILAVVLMPLCGLVTLQAIADEKCELRRYAELPVTMSGMRPIVRGKINDEPANFLADSGAFYSVMSTEAAGRYHLNVVSTPTRIIINGVTDSEVAKMTTVKEFSLTGFLSSSIIKNVQIIVLNGAGVTGDIDGVVGQNVLGGADTEYDLANGAIRLFQSKNCGKKIPAYWDKSVGLDVASVELLDRTPWQPHLIGSALVNGKKIRVVFDSGAWRSTLTRRAAARLGVKPEGEAVKAAGNAGGMGNRIVESWIARFDSMDIGGEKIQNAKLRISNIDIVADADMLLGADFFLSHRIYVAAKQNKIYFTYNGGPVFDLRENASSHTDQNDTQQASSKSDLPEGIPSENALSPAELRRRGAASVERHAFKQALADLDLAIRLDKDDPESYYQRGMAHRNNHEPELALADFNTALTIKPDNTSILLARGQLLLAKKNLEEAKSDFSTAASLSHGSSLDLEIAESYGRAGYYNDMVEHLNAWITANKKDSRMQRVLNDRCHARLMLSSELDQALVDCTASINLGSAYAEIYANRGLVYLKLSNFDKAMKDFKKALKLQPKDARSLYALGVAEHIKGQQADSEKDIQAAITINPNIAENFERMGLKIEH